MLKETIPLKLCGSNSQTIFQSSFTLKSNFIGTSICFNWLAPTYLQLSVSNSIPMRVLQEAKRRFNSTYLKEGSKSICESKDCNKVVLLIFIKTNLVSISFTNLKRLWSYGKFSKVTEFVTVGFCYEDWRGWSSCFLNSLNNEWIRTPPTSS